MCNCSVASSSPQAVVPSSTAVTDAMMPVPTPTAIPTEFATSSPIPNTSVVALVDLIDGQSINANTAQNIAACPTRKSEKEAKNGKLFGPALDTRQHQPHNILVTGGCGFIASNVVNYLCVKYPACKIVNFDCLDYCASRQNVREAEGRENYTFVLGDIRNSSLVEKTFREHAIDTVLHFAALSHVDLSYTSCSPSFIDVNLVGTRVVLEAARRHGVKRFIHVSTDEVYGETGSKCVTEEAPMHPTNPYAKTKAAAEMLVRCYMSTYNMPIIITRGNNVYGPRQYPEKLIPKFICRLLRGQSCCMHGSGGTRRNFMYIDDAVRAFDVIMHYGVLHEIYNIGCEEEFSVIDVAHLLVRGIKPVKAGETNEKRRMEWSETDVKGWMECVEDRQYNDNNYRIDFSKLAGLGWWPLTKFEDGLQATISWYQQINVESHWAGALTALSAHPDKNQKIVKSFLQRDQTNEFYSRFFDFSFFDDFFGYKSMKEKVLSTHREMFQSQQRVVGVVSGGVKTQTERREKKVRIRTAREDANCANFTTIA